MSHPDVQKEKIIAITKTYNSGDSPVVTHLTTSPPVSCLTKAERTGSRDLKILWSYVKVLCRNTFILSVMKVVEGDRQENGDVRYVKRKEFYTKYATEKSYIHSGPGICCYVVVIGCMKSTRIVDMGNRCQQRGIPSDASRLFGRIPSTRTWGRMLLSRRSDDDDSDWSSETTNRRYTPVINRGCEALV